MISFRLAERPLIIAGIATFTIVPSRMIIKSPTQRAPRAVHGFRTGNACVITRAGSIIWQLP
jgi:hypothetical protein